MYRSCIIQTQLLYHSDPIPVSVMLHCSIVQAHCSRLTVRAIAALGDSADSNVVIVHAESDDDEATHKSPPRDDDNDGDDPDRGPEKEPGHRIQYLFVFLIFKCILLL